MRTKRRSQMHRHLWEGWSSRRTAGAIALRWERGSAHSGDRAELKVAAAERVTVGRARKRD